MRKVLVAIGCALVAACHRAPARPPLILISIDTLRSDHLPAYGYRGVETPNIDALARDSIRFDRAYSHVPLTLPSHATILTGALPAETGIRDNLGFTLNAKVPTLAEELKRNGYETGGAVCAYVLHKETGICRGFDFYDDNVDVKVHSLSLSQRSGATTIGVAEN